MLRIYCHWFRNIFKCNLWYFYQQNNQVTNCICIPIVNFLNIAKQQFHVKMIESIKDIVSRQKNFKIKCGIHFCYTYHDISWLLEHFIIILVVIKIVKIKFRNNVQHRFKILSERDLTICRLTFYWALFSTITCFPFFDWYWWFILRHPHWILV